MILYYLLIIIILLVLLYFNNYNTEYFTVYQLNYRTDILPLNNRTPELNRPYNRCICSSDGDCKCISDNFFQDTSVYLPYYLDD